MIRSLPSLVCLAFAICLFPQAGKADPPAAAELAAAPEAAATEQPEAPPQKKPLNQQIWEIRGGIFKVAGATKEERLGSFRKNLEDAYSKIDELLSEDLSPAEKAAVITFKVETLRMGIRAEIPDADARIKSLLEELANSPEPSLKAIADRQSLLYAFDSFATQSPEEQAQLIDRAAREVTALPPASEGMNLAMTLGQQAESAKDSTKVAGLFETFAEHFANGEGPNNEKIAERFRGSARRLNLPGSPMQLVSTTMADEPFDLKDLKGKVVLVDFWATWCGPCLAEVPHMQKLYSKYHEHGFEIVGVSLDDNHEHLKKFLSVRGVPWIVVHENNAESPSGWSDPNAKFYGISAIPAMILIGSDGNVITTHARGDRLEAQLQKLFPDVADPVEDVAPEAP